MEKELGQAAGAWLDSANRPDISAQFHTIFKKFMGTPLAVPQIIRDNAELTAMLCKGLQNIEEKKFNPDLGKYITHLGPNSLSMGEMAQMMAHTVLAYAGEKFLSTPPDSLDKAQREKHAALFAGMKILAPHLDVTLKNPSRPDFLRACRDTAKGILIHAGTPDFGKMTDQEQSLYDRLNRLTVETRQPLSGILAAVRTARLAERV